jgi:hypothetical protein
MSRSASEDLRIIHARLAESRPKLFHEKEPLPNVEVDVGSSLKRFSASCDVVGPLASFRVILCMKGPTKLGKAAKARALSPFLFASDALTHLVHLRSPWQVDRSSAATGPACGRRSGSSPRDRRLKPRGAGCDVGLFMFRGGTDPLGEDCGDKSYPLGPDELNFQMRNTTTNLWAN